MEIVTITNQKGGVGKTTTAHVLACGLHNAGFRVVAVDADPQTNLTYTAGIQPEETEIDLYDLFKEGSGFSSLRAVQTTRTGYSMISGSLNLAGADMEFNQTGREYLLKKILKPLEEKFDFCIVDTPPTLGILTVNALTASNVVIIPMKADIYSLQGLSQLWGMIRNVKEYTNPALLVEGLLLTQYNARATLNRELGAGMKITANQLGTKVYSSFIREAVAVRESAFLQTDIFKQYPKAKVTQDYRAFIDEFLKGRLKDG